MGRLLEIENLNILFGEFQAVKNLNFNLDTNEILGIVGESGSGKSLTSLAVMGLLPNSAKVNGKILFHYKNQEINLLKERKAHHKISMIFQEPMSSLNPSMRCGKQVEESLLQNHKITKKERRNKILNLFDDVALIDPERIYNSYPHQLSGGQKQRVMIAIALAKDPDILIADEPTTALDVTVQKSILELLKTLRDRNNLSILFISHDLGVISQLCDRVLVMYQGEKIEEGSVEKIFKNPNENYTKGLIACRPQLNLALNRLPTVSNFLVDSNFKPDYKNFELQEKKWKKIYSEPPLLEFENINKIFEDTGWLGEKKIFKALENINFNLYKGESLGLVGESGSGKTTLSRALLMLQPPTSGKIIYKGENLTEISNKKLRSLRKEIQIIFQDPYSSLNPTKTIQEIITTPLSIHKIGKTNKERREMAAELMKKVSLSADDLNKYPHEFSGGQRQRIGIARALAVQPELIVCDESVSALDVSVQAQVLNLLDDLQEEFNLTYLFISHDLSIVKHFCDRLLVLQKGKLVEKGMSKEVYKKPAENYTKELIEAIPSFEL